ncbi:MAG TPA: hypothetical protein VFY23_07545 [Candidatus Limnocylindrales bacterium]|nr:hypothetical protein [Candidatus Limnocylindrales bacterium]
MTTAVPVRPGFAIDRPFVVHAVLWAIGSLAAFGLVTAIIPNPVFGRSIPPEPFAIATWLLSAPLIGIVGATYSSPPPAVSRPLGPEGGPGIGDDERSSILGSVAGFGAFLAIGCPVCNKLALVLLGTSGALGFWAPVQPVLAALSLVLLVATAAWRLRLRARGNACEAPAA